MLDVYHVMKMLHLFSMVCWFAGMIGLFRALALHSEFKSNSGAVDVLKRFEEFRYKKLAVPGMIGTWVFGLAMIIMNPSIMKTGGWLHAKLLLVVLLSGFMGFMGKSVRRYAANDAFLDAGKCKLFNNLILVFLFVVMALAVLRPF